ncbi:site-2 protease family protein [bacterium BFN5]|nr:site-2 protease family protein [bacterium BFN5]
MTLDEKNNILDEVNKDQEQISVIVPTAEQADLQPVSGIDVSEESGAPKENSQKRSWWVGIIAMLGLVFGKLKFLMGPLFFLGKLLKLGKFMTTGLSMVIMIVSYTFFYGWKYAAGIVGLIFVHEMGHLYFARLKKIDVSLPVFIPFVGAFIRMKEEPKDVKTESFVAVGGPLIGMMGALICLLIAIAAKSMLWAALAYFGFFMTVFNMIPAHPLDGGRIAASLSPLMWLVGIVAMLVITVTFFNPIGLLILLLSVGKAWKVWKNRDQLPEGYYRVERSFRIKMALAYFSIFAISSFFTFFLHEVLQGAN